MFKHLQALQIQANRCWRVMECSGKMKEIQIQTHTLSIHVLMGKRINWCRSPAPNIKQFFTSQLRVHDMLRENTNASFAAVSAGRSCPWYVCPRMRLVPRKGRLACVLGTDEDNSKVNMQMYPKELDYRNQVSRSKPKGRWRDVRCMWDKH